MTSIQLQITLGIVAFSTCVLIGSFVLWHNPRSRVKRYFGYFNFALALWNAADFGVLLFRHDPGLALLIDRIASISAVVFVSMNVRFYCVLADEVRPPKGVVIFTNVMTPILSALLFSPLIITSIRFDQDQFIEVPGPGFVGFALYLVWGMLYGIYRLLVLYTKVDRAKRVQLQYVLAAFGVGSIGVVLYGFWISLSVAHVPPLYYVFEIAYNVIIAYAIVQHGAMDVRTVVHKTLLWLSTSALIVLPAGIGFLAIEKFWAPPRSVRLGILAAFLLGVLAYARIVQPKIDHRFQRRQYDLYNVIQQLTEQLVALKGIEDASERVVKTTRDVLYSDSVFLMVMVDGRVRGIYPPTFGETNWSYSQPFLDWLTEQNRAVAKIDWMTNPELARHQERSISYLEDRGVEVLLPFVKDGVLLGILHLGMKKNLRPYSALDFEFLDRLRTEVTVAYHNSILYENVSSLSRQLEKWNAELEQKIHLRTQELEGAYNQLKELDEAKTRFFASVSHELRTPLTLILAPLESVLKGDMGPIPDGLQRHVTVMHQNGLRLLKQINNLLDLTKLDAGRMTLECRPGDLRAFFRGLVAAVAPMAEKKYIELKGYEDAPLPRHVHFDPDRLEKVVLNLVFNAIKFTNVGGRVELRWGRSTEGQLQVQVKDTGIGIAEKDLPKLFKRFSQVDASTSRRYEGTGIGLALAKEIIELHGGRIGVESEPGRGSTFTFTIPLLIELPQDGKTETVREAGADGDVASADWTHELHVAAERQLTGISPEPTVAAEPSLSPANGRHVLVVEDNPDMREFVAFELQGDYRVLKAANGIEGIRVAGEILPDVIVSDVMMPEMDGYQLCREIRKDPRTKHSPIILLTARADMAMKIEGLEHGAEDYLTKPFNAQDLRAKIKSLLEQRRLEREIQQRNEALEAALEELKATQTQLVQSEKMAGLGMLVAGMAHEINNPINFAKNSLSVLQRAWEELKPLVTREARGADTVEAVEDVEASLGIVRSGVSRTEQIVGQLKAFVRKDQNQKVVCSVQEGLESTLNLVRPTMGKQIVLHADLQSSGAVLVVPGKLNQVWMNLLQNAAQALGSSGEIWVESRDHEHMVTVTVRDSGPGITAEHMPRLFEPFFTTKPVGQGTGLGLSVSYQIIQDAGGRIEVKSEEGHGAEFTVFLPLTRALSRAA